MNALGISDGPGDGLTSAQRTARANLQHLRDTLTDLRRTLGSAEVGPTTSYRPTTVAVVAEPWIQPDSPAPPEIRWPGPALPGEPVPNGPMVNCVTVSGPAAADVLTAAANANRLTPWVSGADRWRIDFRPLLPDEHDCQDLVN